jgi:uncharacterized iron-regulated protein
MMSTLGRICLVVAAIVSNASIATTTAAAASCRPVAPQLKRYLVGDGQHLSFARAAQASICPTPSEALMAAVAATLAAGGVVFLGEVHDNAVHHSARGSMLQHLVANAQADKTGLVFEHIRADQASALASLPRDTPVTGEAFFAALQWTATGWPDQAVFQPLFEPALARLHLIYPGEPERARVREVSRKGLEALTPMETQTLKLDQPLPDSLQDALLTELEASHCGLVPKAAFGTMALAQRFRDGYLAAAALSARQAHGSAIVFAGNGHVRRDRGAPQAMARMAPDVPVLVVQFLERPIAMTDAAVADVSVVTAPAARADPCIEMRARFGKSP